MLDAASRPASRGHLHDQPPPAPGAVARRFELSRRSAPSVVAGIGWFTAAVAIGHRRLGYEAMSPQAGLTHQDSYVVGDGDTAIALGSGDVPVLATPRLLAWAEAATVRSLAGHLAEAATSVGTRIQLEHVRPTAVGGAVTVTARLAHVDGRLLRFEITAVDQSGVTVGHGQITRVIVDRERFLSRLTPG